MALLVLPRLEHRGNPRAGLRFHAAARLHCFFIGALPRWVRGFIGARVGMDGGRRSECGLSLVGFGLAAHSLTS
jgi:hypothetical protein